MEREQRRLHGEADAQSEQDETGEQRPALERRVRGERHHVERVRRTGDVQPDEAEQQCQRSDEGVEEELQGCPGRARVAPTRNDEVHADDRQVEEDEEQDQVEGDEQSQRRRLEKEEQPGEVRPTAAGPQRVDGTDEEQQRREAQQRKGQAVHAHVVRAADAGDPADASLVIRTVAAVVADPQPDRQQQLDTADGDPYPGGAAAAQPALQRAQDERREQGEEHQDAEHTHLPISTTSRRTTRPTAAWA